MNLRIAALGAALSLILTACPNNGGEDGGTDTGVDAGRNTAQGTCTGECGPNQVCDEATRTCVDGCQGGCALGQLCVKQGDAFACVSPESSCGGNACLAGQTTCVSGNCSCLPFTLAARDTCAEQGRVCHSVYNPATSEGGACEDPRSFEYCRVDCPSGDCGECPIGQGCDDRLFEDFGVCAKICDAQRSCSDDEFCYNVSQTSGFCYQRSLFGQEYACHDVRELSDGGTETFRTFATNPCLKVDDMGVPTEATPTGTCTWVFYRGDVRSYALTYCRSAGQIPLYGDCKTDPLPLVMTDTCSTGLECMPTGTAGNGVCLPICNARLRSDGTSAEPSCAAGSACANIYRFEDDSAVVGVCMEECNVFSTDTNFGCADLGAKAAACVPTSPRGVQRVTGNGDGLCLPLLPNAAAEGQPCVNTDPLQGAACQSGLICSPVSGEATPRCVKPCDVECAAADGGTPPARCATEANATCGAGQTCTIVSGTSGAFLGYCL